MWDRFGDLGRIWNRFGTDLKQIRDFVTTYDTLWYLSESIPFIFLTSFLPRFFIIVPYGTLNILSI